MKKAQLGNIVWPEVIHWTIILVALIITLSAIYLLFKNANSVRGLI